LFDRGGIKQPDGSFPHERMISGSESCGILGWQSTALPWLEHEAKSQVTFRDVEGRPTAVEAVELSTQHDDGIELDALRAACARDRQKKCLNGTLNCAAH
jgi:hypothetical protein